MMNAQHYTPLYGTVYRHKAQSYKPLPVEYSAGFLYF